MKVCKACGVENRDEANFCRGCGVPLPQVKKKDLEKQRQAAAAVKKFWTNVLIGVAVLAAAAGFVLKVLSDRAQAATMAEYSAKYLSKDTAIFGAVSNTSFGVEGLSWGMTTADIMRVYPYAKDSKDPDFTASVFVDQEGFKEKIPHAGFMSMGINAGRLYAIKFEFQATEEYQRQMVKVPHPEARMIGRFMGLLKVFTGLYGKPAFEKYEIRNMGLSEKIKALKSGKLDGGKPSNVYIYWILGSTKAELVLFGGSGTVHLTVRFLYLPVWERVGK